MQTAIDERSIYARQALSGLRQRLRASWIYDLYWLVNDRRLIEERRGEVRFYDALLGGLGRGGLIFDVGANCGQKTDVFLRLGARVVAVDPDEANQEIIRTKFLSYRMQAKPVVIVGKAVSNELTTKTFWVDGPGSALNTLSRKWVDTLRDGPRRSSSALDKQEFQLQKQVDTTTLDELIAIYGRPCFIKIDVEGHEASVLRGLRQPVPFLSFEVNLPEFRPEGLECVDLLAGLDRNGKFNYSVGNHNDLMMKEWMAAREFAEVIERSTAPSLEIFWKQGSPSSTK